jgi:exopolysaccharide production protein ExoZ
VELSLNQKPESRNHKVLNKPKLMRQAGKAFPRRFAQLFELNARDRLLPMEGLRGIAVSLVFLQHYCRQFVEAGHLTGATALFAAAFRNFGNRGVELFFVLSGFLIYGIVIKKKPPFFDFMRRRVQRIYPTFIAAFLLACIIDLQRQNPVIPHGISGGVYILENLLFLPGLFPIRPLSAVNWSLSYEWWFYAGVTLLFSTVALGRLGPRTRVFTIVACGAVLVGVTAMGASWAPIRGLSLIAGMLLAEAERAKVKPFHLIFVLVAIFVSFILSVSGRLTEWQSAIVLAFSFFLLCHFSLFHQNILSRILSLAWCRRVGNISYSFYLVHGIVVVGLLRAVLDVPGSSAQNTVFWIALAPVFLSALVASGLLFLAVEKPFRSDPACQGRLHPAPTLSCPSSWG